MFSITSGEKRSYKRTTSNNNNNSNFKWSLWVKQRFLNMESNKSAQFSWIMHYICTRVSYSPQTVQVNNSDCVAFLCVLEL